MTTIQELNAQFGLQDKLVFATTDSGMPVAQIDTPLCRAGITLQGAQVYSWIPQGAREVIWLSSQARFAAGKSLRGGVPICWPWFGPHESRKDVPAHGFARTVAWTVITSKVLSDGRITLVFALEMDAALQAMWPHACQVEMHITLGKALEMELKTVNHGKQAFTLGEALHTYFAVGDIRQVEITGLENTAYLDKVDGFARKQQTGPVRISQEVDRVYVDTASTCVIHDAKWQRQIQIQKRGSQSTVVWNPWSEKASAMGDMGEQGYLAMVCVESANAASNTISVAPGQTHSLQVIYSLQ